MMSFWSIAEDIVPWVAFTTAMVMIVLVPVRPGGAMGIGAKGFFVASVACYMTGTTASIIADLVSLPDQLTTVVDAIEVLRVPFILMGVYSVYARQQLNDAVAAEQTVIQTSEMMESIVETTPAGIVLLDPTGWITFANGAARRLLDIEESAELHTLRTWGWTIRCGDGAAVSEPRSDFLDIVMAQQVEGLPMTVEWPNGWRRRLAVNAEPTRSGDGAVTGAIMAFIDAEPWRTFAR
ncbi:MAG: PAS domain-containing protein [Coriobacteriia bacterium]|nr:PAS domain-containing protein [Coriobacteriia bacterium]